MTEQALRLLEEIAGRQDKRFDGDKSVSPIKKLWQQHHDVIRLAVLGFKSAEIARMTGFSPQMIRNILKSDVAKRQIEVLQGARDADCIDVMKEIESMAPTAIQVLKDIMEGEANERTKATVAIDVLDRGGFAAPKIIKGDFRHHVITEADLNELKRRAREADAVIDVTPQVEEAE